MLVFQLRSYSTRAAIGSVLKVWIGLLLVVQSGCHGKKSDPVATVTAEIPQHELESLRPQVEAFCGDCHAMPSPESFPKRAWYDEVQQGYRFYWDSGRKDLVAPPLDDVLSFFKVQAPDELTLPKPDPNERPTSVEFTRSSLPFPQHLQFPGVSHIRWQASTPGESSLYFSDMVSGDVRMLKFLDGLSTQLTHTTSLGNASYPAHIEPCDLDRDGARDFLVAELGSFLPEDHEQGKVLWMRPSSTSQTFETFVLAEGIGRVADARPADFDGDGDLDIVVAEFGWRNSGRILLLEQVEEKDGVPKFQMRVLDPRHGSIHVEVLDLNQDARPDFVAVISQEHEVVVAFLNTGNGTFETQTVFSADDPSFGSSGIQVVDLDGDGDSDVLYTNGDTLDSRHLKSSHSVRWLENRGDFPFTSHTLTHFTGAMRAVAADVDNDNDLDVVATAFIPPHQRDQLPDGYDSLIWLEQTSNQQFVRHRLGRGEPGHMTLEVGDFNDDGATDIVTGTFVRQKDTDAPWLTFWWGRTSGSRE